MVPRLPNGARRGLSVAVVLAVAAACGGDEERAPPFSIGDEDGGPMNDSGTTPPEDSGGGGAVDAAAPKTLRVMTFNVKHGEIGGLEAVADVINGEKPDLVGLQELDVEAVRSGKVDQPHRLGQLTGMTSLFRTALNFPDGGSYGVGLLARFPILTSERVALTSSGEQRVLAIVDVELAKGRTIRVGVTHMDLKAASRATQAQEIVAKLGQKPLAIVMGDMNAQPDEESMKTMTGAFLDGWVGVGAGDGFTIPPAAPARRIDYVMFAKDWPKPVAAKVPKTNASDHLPVVVDVPLPP